MNIKSFHMKLFDPRLNKQIFKYIKQTIKPITSYYIVWIENCCIKQAISNMLMYIFMFRCIIAMFRFGK
jgi:hypothetical protein